LSFSDKALEKLNSRKTKVPNWYLDLTLIAKYWGTDRVYHHTAPVNMIYALYESLFLILQEGLENVFKRHKDTHRELVKGLGQLGLKMLVDEPYRLPMLNAVCVPEGVDEFAVRQHLRGDFKIEIGAGLGPLKGKIWRVGLMGHTARKENVERFLKALRQLIT
jgi:alanine-glyoxylate transaminase/serine-glyoxylate transaminase/serine-pyruvate transaminase